LLEILTESRNTAQLSELLLTHKFIFSTSDRRRLTSLKSKSTEEPSLKKSIGLNLTSNKKSRLDQSLKITKTLIFSESQRDMETPESLRDGESRNFLERHIEDLERSLVLDHGILLQSNGLAPELVNMVTSTELNLTTRSTELELEPSMESTTTLIAKTI